MKHFQTEIFELNEAVLNYEKESIGDFVNAIYRNCYNILVDTKNVPKLKDPRREHVIEEILEIALFEYQKIIIDCLIEKSKKGSDKN